MSENNAIKSDKYYVKNSLVNYYLVLMFSVFPLFFTNQFSNIRHDKFYFFVAASGLLILSEIPIIIYSFINDSSTRKITLTDCAFSVLVIVFTISTLMSDDVLNSFTGGIGRFCGLLSFIVFYLLYLIITRNFIYREYVFVIFALAMIIVFLLCILNSFSIDPLGMYEGYSEGVRNDFVSTIGNKNIMSALCCVTVPMFFVMFINNKNKLRFLYLFATALGIFAMIRCDSLSGYLGLVPTFIFIALFYIYQSDKSFSKKMFFLLCGMSFAVIVVLIAFFIYYTVIDTTTSLSGLTKLFRFNDKWGTHRGYMWIKSWEIFKGYSFKNILFGCGTDTFYNAFQPFFAELNARFGDAVNNAAHNEFLNYLLTTGVLGLAAYLSLAVFSVLRAVRAAKENRLALAFVAPVISYLMQSTVNVATIITLPFLIILLSLAENISRKELNGLV